MKNVGIIFIMLLTGISSQYKFISDADDNIVVTHLENNTTLLSFKSQKKYLLLPIEETASESTIQINIKSIPPLKIHLSLTKIDYYVPLDLQVYDLLSLNITITDIIDTAIAWSKLSLSDSFNTNNKEKWRPLYHFTPLYGWMNDPNGMFYKNGTYHLYYQYNPYGSMWGNMHWGHAKSKDLINWTHLPIALYPDSLGAIFSGSCIVDEQNSAGYGKNAIIAFYTSAGEKQSQSMAYSIDDGVTFKKYENNPIITSNEPDFRDPKVFLYSKTNIWIMVLAVKDKVQFYSSSNLKEWKYESDFGVNYGSHGGVWECPDLFELQIDGENKWVLLVNINPGGPFGGSATQYFIGTFNGSHFETEQSDIKWMDYGKDHYATVTWSNAPDNRRIAIAWMSNWEYANFVPTKQYRSANTVPRELFLYKKGDAILLGSKPIEEFNKNRDKNLKIKDFDVEKEKYCIGELLKENEGVYEIEFDLKLGTAIRNCITLYNGKNENIEVVLDKKEYMIYVNRKNTGVSDFDNHFPCEMKAQLKEGEIYKMRFIVDKSSVEIFVNNGEIAITNIVFPSETYNSMNFTADEGKFSVSNFNIYSYKKNSSFAFNVNFLLLLICLIIISL